MPLGYKFAERNVDTFVDWSAVGKNLSDALATEAQDRRTKIKEFEDQNLADIDYLNRAPQGEFTDATNFTNNFAHDAKQQSLINYKLLTSGKMDPRQYTLNRQNMMNGTNIIFDLQKTYQKEFDETMAGVQSNDLQALNLANLSFVEKYGDFTKSKAIINPLDGTVNIGMMQLNPKTGVMELSKDVMPVSLAMNKITTKIKTFKVDEAIDKSIAAFGDRKDAIYSAATTSGAGTITELLGVEALAKYPGIKNFKNTVDSFNEAIKTTISSYFAANKYNLSSVLTQNTGNYDAESYTYDKDLAAKDKTKLLLKVDPNTKLNVLDESAPHFAEQKKEAEGWVRTQIMSRLDSERKITTTAQSNQLRGPSDRELDEKRERDEASNLAEQIGNVIKGSAEQVSDSLNYFAGLGVKVRRTTDALYIEQLQPDGKTIKEIPYYFSKNGKLSNPVQFGKSLISAVNKKGLGEDFVVKELNRFIKPNSAINTVSVGSGYARTRDTPTLFANKVFDTKNLPFGFDYNVFVNKKNVKEAMPILQKQLGKIPGLKIIPAQGLGDNDVTFQIGTAPVLKLNTNEVEGVAQTHYGKLMQYLNDNLPENVKDKILGPDTTEAEAAKAEQKTTGVNYGSKG